MIPTPKNCASKPGTFRFDRSVRILCERDDAPITFVAERLQARLGKLTGSDIAVSMDPGDRAARIELAVNDQPGQGSENYTLSVSPHQITVSGDCPGLLYGVEAICQLIVRQEDGWHLPCLQIEDAPAMTWRGLMLDCSRHFLSKSFLLRCIDLFPALRMNRLHLHLTDDQGWRVQIDAHPELTRIGAFIEKGEQQQGFYSKDDLSEIIDYAAARNVTVVPEIEIPGHSFAAMKSYPSLCCTGEPARNPGHQKDLYCAGKESTFDFLYPVLDEVMAIFPSPVIHIGGDEAPKDRWRECPACRRRMRDERLNDEEALQAYMIQRCSAYLATHDRQAIGWDDILNGTPETDTIVQWWRHRTHGDAFMRDALGRGHPVIASPNSFCYLSFPVSPDGNFAPERSSDLRKVYSADFAPVDLPTDQRNQLLGAECCIWTEHLREDDILPMLFPRVLALTELMWKNPRQRDYDRFLKRVLDAEDYWNALGVTYGPYEQSSKP